MPMLLSNASSALKEILLPFIQNNFPKQTILLDQMKRNTNINFINDEFVASLYTSRHGGIANLADDGNNVISSSGRRLTRGTVPVETVTGAFDISKLTIDATKTSRGAVADMLAAQGTTLASDFGRHLNRQFYGDGIGVVSMVRATGGSVGTGTIAVEQPDANLDDGRSIDWYGTINGDISPTKYLHVDQVIGVGTGGAADGTITSVTGTSIVSGAPTAIVTAANDSIYIQDGSGEGAGTSEFLGMRAALSSTTGTNTYAGVARNTTGWTPQFGSSSEALTLSRLETSYIAAREFSAMDDRFAIFVNKTLYQKYGDILTAMRREVNRTDLLGGWTGLEFAAGAGRVGVFLDYDVPDGEVLTVNLDSWTITEVEPINWMEDPAQGGGALLRLQNTIQYQAVLVWFANMICLSPASNGRETRKSD